MRLLLVVALLALGFATSFANDSEQTAPVGIVIKGTESGAIYAPSAPIGSCVRCGRDVWSPNGLGSPNCCFVFHSQKRTAEGCMECILDALAAPVSSCAR